MTPKTPSIPAGSRLVIFAKDQPEYIPLPAAVDAAGMVMTEWELTSDEWEDLLANGGRVRLWIQSRYGAIQPVKLSVPEPECPMGES